jgi:hypothetical protein
MKADGKQKAFPLVFLLGLFLHTEDEVVCSSETSVGFKRITQRYIPEDRTLQPF